MKYQWALALCLSRAFYAQDAIPNNICVEDVQVIAGYDSASDEAWYLVLEASKRRRRRESQA